MEACDLWDHLREVAEGHGSKRTIHFIHISFHNQSKLFFLMPGSRILLGPGFDFAQFDFIDTVLIIHARNELY